MDFLPKKQEHEWPCYMVEMWPDRAQSLKWKQPILGISQSWEAANSGKQPILGSSRFWEAADSGKQPILGSSRL